MNIIPKFQQGGGFESLFTTYKPIQTESPRQATSRRQQSKEDSEDSDKGKLTEKDLFTMLKDIDGLPNEIQALSNELMNTLRMTSIIGTDNLNSIATTYLKSLTKLKIAKFNKEAFDNALDRAVAKDNLNEIAITPDGRVLALNEDNEIVRFSTKDWAKAKTSGKYQPLTNSNLLWMRSHMPNYVYKNDMLQIVENGIGINEVHKMIKDRFQELGKTETSSTTFIPKEVAKGQKIIEQMISNGPDGYYKIKSDLSAVDEKAIKATFAYIYSTLPANAKTRLAIETPDGTQESVKSIIGSMILGTLDSKADYSIDHIKDNDSSNNEIKNTPYYNMTRMIGGTPISLTVNKGTNYQMDIEGVNYSSIPGVDGKPIGKTSLENLLVSGLQGVITDKNAITFGNIILSNSDFDNIMYDGSGGTMAILPIKISTTGRKVVDVEVLDRWENVNKDLKNMGIDSIYDQKHQQEIIQVLYQNQLEKLINVYTGTINYSALGQFMIVDGYAVDHSNKNIFKNSSFVTKIDDNSEEIPIIEKALSTNSDQNNYKIDVDNLYDWNGHNIVYKGSIYIPITSNQLQALTANGQQIKESAAIQKEYEYQMLEKRLQAKSPNSEIL